MKYPMTAVIARRCIPWLYPDGTRATIEVCLGTPERDMAKGGDWYCPYEIKALIGDNISNNRQSETSTPTENTVKMIRQRYTFGVDSVQALCHALQIVGVEISTLSGSPDHDNDEPEWDKDPNFGFFVSLTNT